MLEHDLCKDTAYFQNLTESKFLGRLKQVKIQKEMYAMECCLQDRDCSVGDPHALGARWQAVNAVDIKVFTGSMGTAYTLCFRH